MSWQSMPMPDEAMIELAGSLVETMLHVGETGEITGDGTGEALPDMDGPLQRQIRSSGESPAETQAGPLWWLMRAAYDQSLPPGGAIWRDQDGYAAEIQALRDWLLPDAPRPVDPLTPQEADALIRWDERMELRCILTRQAGLARGES
jgi:hypothetical protein